MATAKLSELMAMPDNIARVIGNGLQPTFKAPEKHTQGV
jgi:hypothetical protein